MDYSYIRESFNKDYSNNYILSIQLDPDGFSFYVRDKDSLNKPLYWLSKRFEKPGIASLTRELNDFQEYDKNIFYKTIIIYHTDKFCLIPSEIYNPDNQDNYMRLTHSLPDNINFHTSDILELKVKALFCLPEELNRLIKLKFPTAMLVHSACPALNFGIRKSEKTCIIYYYGTSLSITVFEKKDLKLFNIFSVSDKNDLIYYILNALKSCNQKVAETIFYISGVREEDSNEYNTLSKYISKPFVYNPLLQEVNNSDIPVNMLFNHLEALFCVL